MAVLEEIEARDVEARRSGGEPATGKGSAKDAAPAVGDIIGALAQAVVAADGGLSLEAFMRARGMSGDFLLMSLVAPSPPTAREEQVQFVKRKSAEHQRARAR